MFQNASAGYTGLVYVSENNIQQASSANAVGISTKACGTSKQQSGGWEWYWRFPWDPLMLTGDKRGSGNGASWELWETPQLVRATSEQHFSYHHQKPSMRGKLKPALQWLREERHGDTPRSQEQIHPWWIRTHSDSRFRDAGAWLPLWRADANEVTFFFL